MKPIYEPKGKAKEYGEYALNIYTGCPHRCYYCFAPNVLHCDREQFHGNVKPRKKIIEETRKQLEREQIKGKLIHLCFTCDPYPANEWDAYTREIIKLLKEYKNHIQILTKGNGSRDFDLLDSGDWYGITLDGLAENEHAPYNERIEGLVKAHNQGIKTWVSFEPITDEDRFFKELHFVSTIANKVKIGKLNYHPSEINWAEFGHKAEELCKTLGLDYYIKDSLRAEMEKR